jgi:hypothetical protein
MSRAKESSFWEAAMARQHTYLKSVKSITGAAIVWLGIIGLFGNLDRAVPHLSNHLCGAARDGLGVLTVIAPVGWQVLQTFAFDHHILECLLQMLLSLRPLLHVVAGAIQ